MKTLLLLILGLGCLTADASFTQISVSPTPKNSWMDSTITVYQPVDSQGFTVAPVTKKISDLSQAVQTSAQTAIGYLISSATAGGFIVNGVTVTKIADHVEYAPTPIPTSQPSVTGTTAPTNPPAQVIVPPTETVRRAQLSIAVTRTRTSDGATGTIVFTTETLPSSVRDAWLAVASIF